MSEQRQYNAEVEKTRVGKKSPNTLEMRMEKMYTNTRSSLLVVNITWTTPRLRKRFHRMINQFSPLSPATIDNTKEEARTIILRLECTRAGCIAAKLISKLWFTIFAVAKNSMTKKIESFRIFSFPLCDSAVAAETKLLTSNRRLHWGFYLYFRFQLFAQTYLNDFCLLLSQLLFSLLRTHHYTQNQHSMRGHRSRYTFYTQNNNGFAEK